MHLNEFADPKIYALPADDMAAVIKHYSRLGDYGPVIRGRTQQPEGRRKKLMDKWRRDGTKRQSRRRHLSPRRSQ
jgi:hypothetical protein